MYAKALAVHADFASPAVAVTVTTLSLTCTFSRGTVLSVFAMWLQNKGGQ
jgi:hypothetical protein